MPRACPWIPITMPGFGAAGCDEREATDSHEQLVALSLTCTSREQ